jgi:hypothetical protein
MKFLVVLLILLVVVLSQSRTTKVDWKFIAQMEEGGAPKLKGYLPMKKDGTVIGSSGVTVCIGVKYKIIKG